jgi:hypothetical protein
MSPTRHREQLRVALEANRPDSVTPHVVVSLPSFSFGESLLSHYASRLPALEHRYLLSMFMLPRITSCELVFVCCQAPEQEVLDYYMSLVDPTAGAGIKERFTVLVVPDLSARAVAAKLLDRPDLIDRLRAFFRGRPALIEPWNVTADEVELAKRLDAPINGTSPSLWPLGFKSSGRKLFAAAGVPVPPGSEDVTTVDGVVDAVADVRARCPDAAGVVVKTDDSGAGDGNIVIRLEESTTPDDVRTRVHTFPDWYLTDLRKGAVVEQLVTGVEFASPSVQVDIVPDGDPVVLATHEQVLGGESGQVYTGCTFPANSAYTAELGEYGLAVGHALAAEGALGRFSVDFAAVLGEDGAWDVYALEINLRKGGTTHPYCALRHLAPGHYDVERGQWVTKDGSQRFYASTDNLVDDLWIGRSPAEVLKTVADAGLQYDHTTESGVVLHMLSCLAIDGRLGLVAIGNSPEHAAQLYEATAHCLHAAD